MLNAQVDYGRQYLDRPKTGNQIDGLIEQCHDLVSAHGEVSGTALASRILEEYIALEGGQRPELLCRLNDAFGVDVGAPYYVSGANGSTTLLNLAGEAAGHDWGAAAELMDIDGDRLDLIGKFAAKLVGDVGSDNRVTTTTDRRMALEGADYVITTIRVGEGRGKP